MIATTRCRAAIVAFAAILAVTATVTVTRAGTSDLIARQRAKIHAIHARLQQKRQQLDFEAVRESDFKRQLSETNASVAAVQTRLADLERRIQAGLDEEERERRLLVAAQAALQAQRDAYARRLVLMYEDPQPRVWMVLVGARSFEDFVERWDDLRYVVVADQREVVARNAAVRRVDELRITIAATVAQLQADEDRQAQTRSQLAALAEQRHGLVEMAERHRVAVASEVQNLEELSAQEEAELESLVRAQQAELERQRSQGKAAILPPPGSGELQWPLHGPITSPYGMRPNPFGGGNMEYHPGIDIGVDVGTPVAAAANGRVIIAGWVSGYGEYVAIDHGGGISTGYGHLSQIYVSAGQDVQRGQAIGASGNTGRSTGPHLIFEVRRNGTPVDPNPFLQ